MRWREKRSRHFRCMCNFTYLAGGPCIQTHEMIWYQLRHPWWTCSAASDDKHQSGYIAIFNEVGNHYNDGIMGAMVSQITSLLIVYSIVYSGTDQRKYQSSTSLTFVRGIHRWPVNSPHKWPLTRKMFPFDNVIMRSKQRVTFFTMIIAWWLYHYSSVKNWDYLPCARPVKIGSVL